MRKIALRVLPGSGEAREESRPDREPRSRLDEEIIEDAATRHEQFTEEGERWQDDRLHGKP